MILKLLALMKAQPSWSVIISLEATVRLISCVCFGSADVCRILQYDGSTHEERVVARKREVHRLVRAIGGLGIVKLFAALLIFIFRNPHADPQVMDRQCAHREAIIAIPPRRQRAAQKFRLDQLVIHGGHQQQTKSMCWFVLVILCDIVNDPTCCCEQRRDSRDDYAWSGEDEAIIQRGEE
jgi:hypothetical protein